MKCRARLCITCEAFNRRDSSSVPSGSLLLRTIISTPKRPMTYFKRTQKSMNWQFFPVGPETRWIQEDICQPLDAYSRKWRRIANTGSWKENNHEPLPFDLLSCHWSINVRIPDFFKLDVKVESLCVNHLISEHLRLKGESWQPQRVLKPSLIIFMLFFRCYEDLFLSYWCLLGNYAILSSDLSKPMLPCSLCKLFWILNMITAMIVHSEVLERRRLSIQSWTSRRRYRTDRPILKYGGPNPVTRNFWRVRTDWHMSFAVSCSVSIWSGSYSGIKFVSIVQYFSMVGDVATVARKFRM